VLLLLAMWAPSRLLLLLLLLGCGTALPPLLPSALCAPPPL
jgi:hypothetical protein